VHLLERFLLFGNDGRVWLGNRVGGQDVSIDQIGEFFADKANEAVVVEIAGGGDENVAGRVDALVEIEQKILAEFLDGLARAEDGFAEAVTFPEIANEGFVQDELGLIGLHFYLFEDDAFFLLDVGFPEDGIEGEVGEDVEREREVLVQNFSVETDELFAGEGVEAAADGIDFARDVFGGAGLGAFENHVLDEMRDAVFRTLFDARAAADPDA
jgi:hypothetical protein